MISTQSLVQVRFWKFWLTWKTMKKYSKTWIANFPWHCWDFVNFRQLCRVRVLNTPNNTGSNILFITLGVFAKKVWFQHKVESRWGFESSGLHGKPWKSIPKHELLIFRGIAETLLTFASYAGSECWIHPAIQGPTHFSHILAKFWWSHILKIF